MANFSLTCTCGDVLNLEAGNRDQAIGQLKAMMDEAGVAHHFAERHPGQPVPPVDEVHAMIEQVLIAA